MEGNASFTTAMAELGLTQVELAEKVNGVLRSRGCDGTVSDRTVRNWVTGKTKWPHQRQREALEAVFGCTAEDLGFRPPPASSITDPESPVRRRTFFSATTGTAVSVMAADSRPMRVGSSDVIRLRSGLDALMALDDSRGGHEGLERAALAGADEALGKLAQAASQRIRQRLFSLAADYMATAAWSALDARRLHQTQQHLDRSLYLAGMAKDPIVEMRVWNSYAMLAHQRREYSQAVDAGYAAQATAITRRNPLFSSLAHARTAIGYSNLGDEQAAIRSLGYAKEALSKASTDEPRPSWMAFYGEAELSAIAAIVKDRIGRPADAEAESHRALGTIPRQFRRNRALASTRLALAQLHQRDIDQACDSASKVFDLMAGYPLPGRMRTLLGDFHRDLITLAPDAGVAREWGDRFRAEWSRS
ncbi:XRE family transcriptional regulator [Streptomyces griseorubiginosus]|uniref:XRE family transcriptional regulator n=1 Tax=Streptomyces griseorubiginosus TaxID=67304 RepID=UPI0036E2DBA3